MRNFKGFGDKSPKIAMSKVGKTKRAIQNNVAKNEMNKTLAMMGLKHKQAIILDGSAMKTTKALIKYGWNPNKIHNVNNSVDYDTISKHHKNSYDMTLFDFLDLHKGRTHEIGCIYMDYMCSWKGNDYCKPKDDLLLLFCEEMLARGAILGITLSARTKSQNEDPFTYPDIGKLLDYIYLLANDTGYELELVKGGAYNNAGPMFSYIFRVN